MNKNHNALVSTTTLVSATAAALLGASVLAGCSEPPPTCQVSSFLSYGSTWKQTAGDAASPCGGITGETVGFSSYSPRNPATNAPDLSKASLAIRTQTMGDIVVNANGNDVVDPDENKKDVPFAFGAFASIFPDPDNICKASPASAHEVLDAVAADVGDPEDPDDDVVAQDAHDITEEWSNVRVFVTAAAEGTQVQAHYKVTDNGCTAEYDTLSVFPSVSCEDIEYDGDAVDIASIEEAPPAADGTRPVQIVTASDSGLAVGDAFEVAGVDDDAGTVTYDNGLATTGAFYTVASVSTDGKTIVTNELDPFGGAENEPDAAVAGQGTIRKLVSSANDKFCEPAAIPTDASCDPTAANAPLTPPPTCSVGSGINPAFKTKCDPDTFLCVLDADPTTAKLPVVKPGQTL